MPRNIQVPVPRVYWAPDQKRAVFLRNYLLKQLNRLIATAGLQWDDKAGRDSRSEHCKKIFDLVRDSEIARSSEENLIERSSEENLKQLGAYDDKGIHARKLRQKVLDYAAEISREERAR